MPPGGYSVKPGRGQSAMGVLGGVVGGVMALVMTGTAVSMGAPGAFLLLGILMAIFAWGGAAISFHNATGKKRFSKFDVVASADEPDPFDPSVRELLDNPPMVHSSNAASGSFCPYCGVSVAQDHRFCHACGESI